MTTIALELALNVQVELQSKLKNAERLRKQRVERAQYESELARQRFMQVDPNNRLVADNLEIDWNNKLRSVREAQEEYDRQCNIDKQILTVEQNENILSLSTDFAKLWKDNRTSDYDKKRIVRLLLEDVTLIRGEQISINIRFKGGETKTLTIPLQVNKFIEKRHRQ